MDATLKAQAEKIFAEFFTLPLDAHGGCRVPGQLRGEIVNLCLDVMADPTASQAVKAPAPRILAMLTRKKPA